MDKLDEAFEKAKLPDLDQIEEEFKTNFYERSGQALYHKEQLDDNTVHYRKETSDEKDARQIGDDLELLDYVEPPKYALPEENDDEL